MVVLGSKRIAVSDPSRLVEALAPYRPLDAVVETSSSWPWLHEIRTAAGVRFVLAHARRLRAIAEANDKRDELDAAAPRPHALGWPHSGGLSHAVRSTGVGDAAPPPPRAGEAADESGESHSWPAAQPRLEHAVRPAPHPSRTDVASRGGVAAAERGTAPTPSDAPAIPAPVVRHGRLSPAQIAGYAARSCARSSRTCSPPTIAGSSSTISYNGAGRVAGGPDRRGSQAGASHHAMLRRHEPWANTVSVPSMHRPGESSRERMPLQTATL
jgi:hypothetical protein